MALNNKTLIELHQEALQAAATEKAKQWWEKYMKGVIPFRGVGIPVNRELLAQWRIDNALKVNFPKLRLMADPCRWGD